MRLYLYGALLGGLILGVLWYGSSRYDAGYDKAQLEQQIAIKTAVDARQKELTARYEEVLARKEKERADTLALIEQLQAREPEVIEREIVKYVENASCTNLGSDFVRLFNQIHDRSER